MLYGDDKAKQMARSILPARNRRPARVAKALRKRGARHGRNQEVRGLTRAYNAGDEDLDAEHREARLQDLISWRRSGDKLNHFERWARAVTRALPLQSRLSAMRAVLPNGLVGEHALGHLEHDRHFAPEPLWRSRYRPLRAHLDRGEMVVLLRQIIRWPQGHGRFNKWLRFRRFERLKLQHGANPAGRVPRLLLGLHDVEPFLSEVFPPPRRDWFLVTDRCREQRDDVDAFLRLFKQHGLPVFHGC